MPRLTRRQFVRRHPSRRDPEHVHVYDRKRTDPDYLGLGAVVDVCVCGAPKPVPTRITR